MRLLLFFFSALLLGNFVFAPATIPVFAAESFSGFETIDAQRSGDNVNAAENRVSFQQFFNALYQTMNRLVILAAFLSGMYGAYIYMFSGPDPKKIESAKRFIIDALLAIVVVTLLYLFIRVTAPDFLTPVS